MFVAVILCRSQNPPAAITRNRMSPGRLSRLAHTLGSCENTLGLVSISTCILFGLFTYFIPSKCVRRLKCAMGTSSFPLIFARFLTNGAAFHGGITQASGVSFVLREKILQPADSGNRPVIGAMKLFRTASESGRHKIDGCRLGIVRMQSRGNAGRNKHHAKKTHRPFPVIVSLLCHADRRYGMHADQGTAVTPRNIPRRQLAIRSGSRRQRRGGSPFRQRPLWACQAPWLNARAGTRRLALGANQMDCSNRRPILK